jgi:diguanylate cyclase (GGDEF)-like protein
MVRPRTLAAVGTASFVLVTFSVFLLAGHASEHTVLVVNNLLQTVSALTGGLVCALVAWRGRTGRGTGWAAMAVALVGWGLGQAYWSWSEIIAKVETPFPSPADIGFLIFPVAAAIAVLLMQRGHGRGHLRSMCDGLIVASALFMISWAVVLAPVYSAGGDTRLAFLVSLAYPLGDLVVVALVFRLLSMTTDGRLPMAVLSLGLIAMGVADSGFTYLSTAGTYHTGSVIDVGWVAAFLICAVAAVSDTEQQRREVESKFLGLGLYLPLLPFAGGLIVLVVQAWRGDLSRPLVIGGAVLFTMISVRQMLVLAENSMLIDTVRQREEQLRYQAFHDPLTGLANRLLFRDRLEHAATLRQRDPRGLTVLFLDLDDFKIINDRLGHAAGDTLLVGVAERLRASLRPSDTVARFGGDEFAVLLEDDFDDAETLAARVVDAFDVPFQIDRHRVRVRGSVGVATRSATGTAEDVADRLLHAADVAMYAAKAGEKGSYVVYRDGMRMTAAVGDTGDFETVGG